MNSLPRTRAKHSPCRALTTALALAASLAAQAPTSTEALRATTPLPRENASPIRAMTAGDVSGGLWAGGPDYKVSFHDGACFYPRVGPRLPHQPLRWRTTSVRAGGVELLAATTAPSPRHGDWRCEYEFGPVVERYDVRGSGVEQSFVVTARPAPGELVITGEITTPLRVEPREPRHEPLVLRLDDGREVIRYGTALAIDAAGRTTPVLTACNGREVTLHVAAETMATATFPLVVDPLISSTLLDTGDTVDDVDVLHETITATGTQARTWVAYSRTVAAGDRDLWLYRFGTGFGGAGTEVFREISGADSTHGRLALAPDASRVVLVFQFDLVTNRVVALHNHDVADNFLVLGLTLVAGGVGISAWRPDVGGREAAGNRVLITFQQEAVAPFANTATSSVYACVYDASTATFPVAPVAVRPLAGADQERPVVNQSSDTEVWLLAFQEHNGNIVNDDWDVQTLVLNGAGTVLDPGIATAQAGNLQLHKVAPQVAGGTSSSRFLLTYGTRAFEQLNPKPSSVFVDRVYAQRVDWNPIAATGSLPHPEVLVQSAPVNGLQNVALAYDPVSTSHWCAGVLNDALDNYRLHKLGYTGNEVEGANVTLGVGGTPVALAVAFEGESRAFQVAYGANSTTAGNSRVYGTQMQYDPVAPPTLLGFSCGSGVWGGLGATAKRQQIGSQAMPLRLTNAPQDLVAVLAVSTGQVNLPLDPIGMLGCTLHADLDAPNFLGLVNATIVNGQAVVELDLPESLAPATLYLQWGYLLDSQGTLILQASEGLAVELGR